MHLEFSILHFQLTLFNLTSVASTHKTIFQVHTSILQSYEEVSHTHPLKMMMTFIDLIFPEHCNNDII